MFKTNILCVPKFKISVANYNLKLILDFNIAKKKKGKIIIITFF